MAEIRTLCACVFLLSVLCVSCGPARPVPYQPVTPSEEEAAWDASFTLERAGKWSEAATGYDALCQRRPPYERACYDLVRIAYEHGPAAPARSASVDFIRRFPETPLAPVAVDWFIDSCSSSGDAKTGMATLLTLSSEIEGSEVWDSVVYGVVRLAVQVGDRRVEKEALQSIVRQGRWGSQLYDNAIWRLIGMERENRNAAEEERLIRKMLGTRESSWFIGSYHSGLHDDALLRLGELLFSQNRTNEAYRVFHELSQWTTSPLSDEGLLHAAQVQFSVGKKKSACRHLDLLLKGMAGASAVPSAQEHAKRWYCENTMDAEGK